MLLTPTLPFISISVPIKFHRLNSPTLFIIQSSYSKSPPSMEPKKVAVCGGGVIGVCTAYFLSKKGVAVTLIEQSAVACAASGKAGGFLALDWCDGGPLACLARASFELHRSLSEELDGPHSYGYRPLTTLCVSVTEASSSSSFSSSSSTGPDRAKTLPSWVNGPVKSPKIIGSTNTTAQVHPQLFTKKLLSKAMEDYGLELIIGKVGRVKMDEMKTRGVVLEDGREILADSVVLALGPWSGNFSVLGSGFGVYGMKAHSIVLEPKEPNRITPHALFLTYYSAQGGKPMDPEVYPRPTGEVYICGMSARAEVPDDPEQITPVPESIDVLKRVAASVSGHLAEGEATVKTEQACILPCSEDDVPIIGEVPGLKGCYVATAHSCWGILNGPATGAAMAELILDGHASIVDLSRFSPARFANVLKK